MTLHPNFPYLYVLFRKAAHIIFVASMYLLLLFGTTAKEFIHLFAGHHDTVHVEHSDGGLSFENEHHHCDFLSYSLPAFDNDITLPFIAFVEQSSCSEFILGEVQFVQRGIVQTSLRGPPSFTA